MTLIPPFLRPGPAGVLAHFTALTAASPVPVVAYHVPYRTAQPLSAATSRGREAVATLRSCLLHADMAAARA